VTDVGLLPAMDATDVESLASRRRVRIGLAALFGVYAIFFAVLFHQSGSYVALLRVIASSVVFLGLMGLLRASRLRQRIESVVLLGGSALLQLVALTKGPTTSDDVYRYIWDGRVQLSGTDPYAYAPQAPQLDHLRDGLLFGPTSTCAHQIPGGCTAINRPSVHTIYPPVAQLFFDVVRLLSFGGHGGARPFQIAAAFGVVILSALLLRDLRRRGRPGWFAALWGWSPLVVIEYGNNAHIDWLAALLGIMCIVFARSDKAGWVGILLGAATLTKLYPAVLAPALLRRRPAKVVMAAVAVGVIGYLPHVLAVGTKVIGYLPGYLQEEGYDSGRRSLLLGAVLPHPVDTVVGAIILACVAWWTWRRTDPLKPERTATIMVGVAFLVTTPSYGWYAGMLLALVAISEQCEWLPVVLAPMLTYIARGVFAGTTIYAAAALLTLALSRYRRGSLLARSTHAASPSEVSAGELAAIRVS
jgi:hypothetical protein